MQPQYIFLSCLLLPSVVQNLHRALQNCQRIYDVQHKIYSPIPSQEDGVGIKIMIFYLLIQTQLFKQNILIGICRAVCMVPLREQPAFQKTAFKSEVLNNIFIHNLLSIWFDSLNIHSILFWVSFMWAREETQFYAWLKLPFYYTAFSLNVNFCLWQIFEFSQTGVIAA